MPFPTLNSKVSKPKLRSKAPPPALTLDLSTHKLIETASLPTPPMTGDSMAPQQGFKMFTWKKKSATGNETPTRTHFHIGNTATPRPILKVRNENPPEIEEWEGSLGWNENRARGVKGINPDVRGQEMMISHDSPRNLALKMFSPPSVVISNFDQKEDSSSLGSLTTTKPPPTLAYRVSSRKSSRPTSPSNGSFGARIRTDSGGSIGTIYTQNSNSSDNESSRSASPLVTPPMPSSHITTPPTAYVSTLQSRAPPPPSPYRPTHERQRSQTLPEGVALNMDNLEYAPRPPRHSSLFPFRPSSAYSTTGSGYGSDTTVTPKTVPNSESYSTLKESEVPMLNIIPATPQEDSEEFPGALSGSRRKRLSKSSLEEAMTIDEKELEDVPLDAGVSSLPSIDVDFDFSPFGHVIALPPSDSDIVLSAGLEDSPEVMKMEIKEMEVETVVQTQVEAIPERENTVPTDPLPPSPPFNSYPSFPSFPSLSSETSMPSFDSTSSMPSSTSSSSASSLTSFPDVEEALGSMLASLSDLNMVSQDSQDHVPSLQDMKLLVNDRSNASSALQWATNYSANPGLGLGLGLGLDLPDEISITAPLSPRRRRQPPPPLKLVQSTSSTSFTSTSSFSSSDHSDQPPIPHSAPARVTSHRIPFYQTAKAHPSASIGSVTSVHTRDLSFGSHFSTEAIIYDEEEEVKGVDAVPWRRGSRDRDSISLASEASDDDLHTASIISLAPLGRAGSMVRVGTSSSAVMESQEVIMHEVGLAL